MAKKQMSVGVKASIVGGVFLVVATIIGSLISNSKNDTEKTVQKAEVQKVDSDTLNNYKTNGNANLNNNSHTITNNKVEQKNSANGNIQIGDKNVSK